jgi:hypothetical protein
MSGTLALMKTTLSAMGTPLACVDVRRSPRVRQSLLLVRTTRVQLRRAGNPHRPET